MVVYGCLIPIVYLAWRKTRAPAAMRREGFRRPAWLPFAAAGLFVSVSGFLKTTDIFWRHWPSEGWFPVAYTGARGVLMIFLFLLCTSLGDWLLRRWSAPKPPGLAGLLCRFFLGAAVYQFAGTVLGLVGLVTFPVALALTLPFAFRAPSMAGAWREALGKELGSDETGRFPQACLIVQRAIVCLLLAALALGYGLNPTAADGDVWEHYLPYYREVLRSGSSGPNALWIQFFLSKGAGLAHLSGAISDPLAAQMVAWCFCAAIAATVAKLVRDVSGEPTWGLLAAGLALALVLADRDSAGVFFKHHLTTAAYFMFLLWATYHAFQGKDLRETRPSTLACITASFGFSLPVPASSVLAGLGLVAVTAWVVRRFRAAAWSLTVAVFAGVFGVVASLFLNHVTTGVLETQPFERFWSLADRKRFLETHSPGDAAFLLYRRNDLPTVRDWTGKWMGRVVRASFLQRIFVESLFLMVVALMVFRRIRGVPTSPAMVAFFAAVFPLVLPSVVLVQLFQLGTALRAFLFLGVALLLGGSLLMHRFCSMLTEGAANRLCAPLMGAAFTVTAFFHGILGGLDAVHRGGLFAAGASAKSSFRLAARGYEGTDKFDFFNSVRERLGPDERIVTFGYTPGVVYSFPGRGLESEPNFSMGPDHLDLVFGSPDAAASRLRDRGFRYFHIDLGGHYRIGRYSQLFHSLAFSELFRPEHLNRYFRVVHGSGDQYLLTWRERDNLTWLESENREPLPEPLLLAWEFKRTRTLGAAFRDGFYGSVGAAANAEFGNRSRLSPSVAGTWSSKLATLLEREGQSVGRSPEAGEHVKRLLRFVEAELLRTLPGILDEGQKRFAKGQLDDLVSWITLMSVTCVQHAVTSHCLRTFGPWATWSLTRFDEIEPFGRIYAGRREVEERLQ